MLGSFVLNGAVSGMQIQSSSGEPLIETVSNNGFTLTQGFQQPFDRDAIVPNIEITYLQCVEQYRIFITGITGCVNASAASYTWNNIPALNEYFTTEDSIHLVISGGGSCLWTADILIDPNSVVQQPCEPEFFNYISPNGDGDNDTWQILYIDALQFLNNSVTIINRWGVEVWSAENYDNTTVVWNGLDESGNALPDGTYFYVARINDTFYEGYIDLQR